MNPPDEFELSDPRRCRPQDSGVGAPPGGDMLMLCGVLTPGERDKGEAWWWIWDVTATAAAAVEREVVVLGWGEVDGLFEGWEVGEVALVAIDRAFDGVAVEVAVLGVVETWAEGGRAEDEFEEVALYAGLECARKAARKFAKKGRFVGMMMVEQVTRRWTVLETWRLRDQLKAFVSFKIAKFPQHMV